MRVLPIFLILILIGVFALNAWNVFNGMQASAASGFTGDHQVMGYDPQLNSVAGFKEIEERMSRMIHGYKEGEKACAWWGFMLNLLVTIVTGVTALISTISTIRNGSISKGAGTGIAIVTFVASLLSFGQSELSTNKDKHVKHKDKVIEIRREMEALTPAELPAQLVRFNRQLDEEF